MSARKVVSDAVYVMISTAALALLQWLIMAFIARLDGPSALGNYTLAQALATPAGYLAWLSMRQQLLMSQQGGASLADFLLLRITVPLLLFGTLLVFIHVYYGSASLVAISFGVLAVRYAEGFFDLIYGQMQQTGQTRTVATTSLSRCAVSLVAFAAIYILTRSLPLALWAIAIIWMIFFVTQRKRLWPFVDLHDLYALSPSRALKLARIAVHLSPLAISATVMSFNTNASRFLLEHQFGPAELGFFAAAYHFLALGSIVVGSLGHSLLPRLSASLRERRASSFWKQLLLPTLLMQGLAFVGAVIAYFTGSQLLHLVYGPAFSAHGDLLVWAAVVAGPLYGMALLMNGLHAAQMKRSLLAAQIIGLLTLVASTLILAPRLGLPGGFLGILIGALVQAVAGIVQLRRFWRRRSPAS